MEKSVPSLLDWRVVPQGIYDATIDQISINAGAITWLRIGYLIHIRDEQYWVVEMLALEAPADSPDYQRCAEGKGRIKQILRILNIPEDAIQDLPDIEARLRGAQIKIVVAHRLQHGLPVATVRAVIGKGTAPAEGAATS
jgi:hypothetical protein